MKITRVNFVLGLLCSNALSAAAQPLFEIIPLTQSTLQLGRNQVVTVQYRVTNKTSVTRSLTMQPVVGITQQISGDNYCDNPFTLTTNQSCLLSLSLDGSMLSSNVKSIPVICKTQGNGDNSPDPFLCSRPSFLNSIQITGIPRATIPLSAHPAIFTLQNGGPPATLTVTNHTDSPRPAVNITATLPTSWSDVTQNSDDCQILAPGQSCDLVFTPGNTSHTTEVVPVQGLNTLTTTVDMSVETVSTTALSQNVSTLGLSVNNTSLNAALTGNPRKIIITNTGASTAFDVTYSISTALPSGTTITPGTCGTISPGATCELSITPGASDGASAMIVSGSNTNTLHSDIDVLTYGSTYQSGYIFAVDDTTPNTESMGGKITALEDQASAGAPSNPNGSQWTFDLVAVYAISITSTPSNPIPNVNNTEGQSACYGARDGSCNTTNILAYYDTESGASSNTYAAGRCLGNIDGYSDWVLPAICQLGYGNQLAYACGSQSAPTVQQNIQTTLIDNGNLGNFQEGYYWSSTQGDPSANTRAHYKSFITSNSFLGGTTKNNSFGVRCIRDLDY